MSAYINENKWGRRGRKCSKAALLAVSCVTAAHLWINTFKNPPCALWVLIAKAGFTDVWTCSLGALLREGCWFGSDWLIEADWLHGWVTWCYLWLLKSPVGSSFGTGISSEWRVDGIFQLRGSWFRTSTNIDMDAQCGHGTSVLFEYELKCVCSINNWKSALNVWFM